MYLVVGFLGNVDVLNINNLINYTRGMHQLAINLFLFIIRVLRRD